MSDIVIENVTVEAPPVEEKKPEVQMMDVLAQEVILLEDCVIVKVGKGAAEVEKRISYEDFKAIITTALGRREDEKLDGFSLPSNCFYFAKSASVIQLSCYYQERNAEITYFDKKMTIRIPNLIISHVLERKTGCQAKLTSSKYMCTDQPINRLPQNKFINAVESSKRVFLSPFSNTYQEGNMCFGGNTMPGTFTDNNLRGLDYYYQFLFSSPFNSDLGIYALSRGREYVTEWYEELETIAKQAEPKFPYERLRGAS